MQCRRVASLLICLAPLLLGGCGVLGLSGRSRVEERRIGPGQVTATQVQSELMSFTDTFNGLMSQQWNQAVEAVQTASLSDGPWKPTAEEVARARRSALEARLAMSSAVMNIATSPNPIVGVADLITVITLQRMVLEDERTARTFGPQGQASLIAMFLENERRAWRIAERVYTEEQQQELRDLIVAWRETHPTQRYVASVRLEDFARDRQIADVNRTRGTSVLSILGIDPLAGLDPTTREVEKSRILGERMFFYASRSPTLVKLHTESLLANILRTPEVKKTLEAVDRTSSAADTLATEVAALPKNVEAEREATLDHAFKGIAQEREATVNQIFQGLTDQREGFLNDLDKRHGELQTTAKEIRTMIVSAQDLADTVQGIINDTRAFSTTVTPFGGDGIAPPKILDEPDRDVLRDYAAAVEKTGATVDRLNTLATRVESIISGPYLAKQAEVVQTGVANVELSSKAVIDHAFWRLLILVIVAPIVTGATVLLVRKFSRKPRTT